MDHVPPKSLFPRPRPNNLVSVPSCAGCNNRASKDDEYFRMVAVLMQREHSAAKQLLPEVMRAFERPQKMGFKKAFEKAIADIPIYTRIYLGDRLMFEIDYHRMELVAERIVKGLFFAITRRRLPHDCDSIAWCENARPRLRKLQDHEVSQTLMSHPSLDFGESFSLKAMFHSEDEFASVWRLVFYGRLVFVCATGMNSLISAPKIAKSSKLNVWDGGIVLHFASDK